MTQDIRNKVKQFLISEVGQATIKGPLALGVASGALLLSQAVHTPSAAIECIYDDDCGSGRKCDWNCVLWSQGTCVELETQCVPDGS